MYTCVHSFIIHTVIHSFISANTQAHMPIYVFIYIYIYICQYQYIYIYIYIHSTYTDMPINTTLYPNNVKIHHQPDLSASLQAGRGGLSKELFYRLISIITPIRTPSRLHKSLLLAHLLSPPTLQVQAGRGGCCDVCFAVRTWHLGNSLF